MSVVVKEVITNAEKKKWVDFPNKLYKKVENYVPFMFNDEMDTFNPKINPAFEFCEARMFLAYKDKKIVGRIAGVINHAANKKWNTNYIRYTRFDFIDDFEVSSALLNAVIEWGKERGYTGIIGPIGFTDMDHEGMLVEGYNEFNMSFTYYNHPYYLTHMEKLGLSKEVDWVEYQLTVPKQVNPRHQKISEYLQKKYGYELVVYNDRKKLSADAFEAFKVIDVAFSVLYGSVPLTDKVIEKCLADYIPLVNLRYICSVKDREGKIVGFAVLVPSLAKALKKSNGKMFPFGIFRLLKALKGKNDTLEMYFLAVSPEHQGKGVPAIIIAQIIKVLIEDGIKICETGPELENNSAMRTLWDGFDTIREHKRRRCFKKDI